MKAPKFADDTAIWLKVYKYLRDKIVVGEISVNQRIVEATIAKEVGTSRTPVREALHNLQQEGFLESVPRVGYRVKPISREEVVQICTIRGELDYLSTCWAIEKKHKKLVMALKKNISVSEDKVANGNNKAFIVLDSQFHETLSMMSGSSHLFEMSRILQRHMARYRIESFDYIDIVLGALDGHKRILDAIEKADYREVRKAINSHLERSLRAILGVADKKQIDTTGNEVINKGSQNQ